MHTFWDFVELACMVVDPTDWFDVQYGKGGEFS